MRTEAPPSGSTEFSLRELADAVNAWCGTAGIVPANGQVGESLTERNIRFYRTIGLVDAPVAGGGRGYTEKHLLQLVAIRLLQAQGLPLRRIRELLFGRSLEDLREIRERGQAEVSAMSSGRSTDIVLTPGDSWQLLPLTPDVALLTKSTSSVSPDQLNRIRAIIEPNSDPTRHAHFESQ